MRPTTKKLLALSAAASLGLAACGGGSEVVQPAVSGEAAAVEPSTTTTTAAPSAAQAEFTTEDPASILRATLASLLQEHAYLTGAALETVLDTSADDPAAQAALDAVDQNTVALGEAIASIPGVDDPDAFVERWRDHVGYFVDYTVARAEEDGDGVDQALSDLQGYQQDTADFFDELTDGELVSDEVFGELDTHVTMVTAAVDAMLGLGEAEEDPFTLLRDAAGHMEGLAATLAEAIVTVNEQQITGDPGSVPATTRADLAAALQEQVYLLGIAAEQMAEAGDRTDPTVQAAVSLALSGSEGLGNTIGGAAGNAERGTFLDAWRPHVDALLEYATARTTGDATAAGAARSTLDTTSAQVATTLGQITAGGADIGPVLDTHVQTLTAAIDAIAAGDASAVSQLRAAAQVMPQVAATLAPAIVALSASEDAATGQGTEGGGDSGEGTGEAPDEAAEGSSSAGTADGAAPGAGADQTGPGVGEEPEPPGSPAEAEGPEADGEIG